MRYINGSGLMGCPGVEHSGLFHWFEGVSSTKSDGVDDAVCILAIGF